MHNQLGSWVTLPCHIHLGGALKMIEIKSMHSSPSKVNDHIWDIRDNIIQASIKVAYDQTQDHTSISQGHRVSNKHTIKFNPTKSYSLVMFHHTRMLSSCTTPMTSQAIVSYFNNLKLINLHAMHEREPWI